MICGGLTSSWRTFMHSSSASTCCAWWGRMRISRCCRGHGSTPTSSLLHGRKQLYRRLPRTDRRFLNKKSSQPDLAHARQGERLKLCCSESATVFSNVLTNRTQFIAQQTDTPLLGNKSLLWPVFMHKAKLKPNLAHAKGGEKAHASMF